jgi:hypothetical protein
MGHRYLDIRAYLPSRKTKTPLREIAAMLNGKTWE